MSNLEMVTTSGAIIGQVLANLWTRKGIKQSKLAAAVKISPSTWSRIENGDSSISIDQLRAAAKALDVINPGLIIEMVEKAEQEVKIHGVKVKTSWNEKSVNAGAILGCATASVPIVPFFGSAHGAVIMGTITGAYAITESNKDEQKKP